VNRWSQGTVHRITDKPRGFEPWTAYRDAWHQGFTLRHRPAEPKSVLCHRTGARAGQHAEKHRELGALRPVSTLGRRACDTFHLP